MSLRTVNNTDKRVWITVYDSFGHQCDYGWCDVGSFRDWTGQGTAAGLSQPDKVRGEVKSDAQGSDPTIFDTEAMIRSTLMSIVKGNGNYYWEWE